MLNSLLYSVFTHDCVATHVSNSIIKFADDTTVVGLITNKDETTYREEVGALAEWCQENNLSLNVKKTKELFMEYWRQNRIVFKWSKINKNSFLAKGNFSSKTFARTVWEWSE